ncbi:MAG TPA: isovaleryl-CoA dehydrogenase [Ideonella sp.]|nr:isovaleryl-CoA dehydrogenase [Ideonella sp.]
MTATHEVFNQPTPFENRNLYAVDDALREALGPFAAGWAHDELNALGAAWGSAAMQALARDANDFPPRLRTHDARGVRIDEIEFHPAWHTLMGALIASGAHAAPWSQPRAGAQVARAAKYLLWSQVENGTQCPATMTFAVVPVIAAQPALAPKWMPKLLSRDHDPRSLPMPAKHGVLMGMGMTEKQGGSDVRANTTRADFAGHSEWGEAYRLTGHKWFFSAPQADAHLVLAKIGGERLSCFFMPRFLPDGTRNAVRVQRLKDKLGNRSNASAEVEFDGAMGWLVGEAGRGIATILEMGNHTRLDCALGAAGIMRATLTHALHHARERKAFGRLLAEQPLMRNVLAELALESEAATWLALRLARSFDTDANEAEQALRRVLTPLAKYWLCKRVSAVATEAMEVQGGSGYVEESPLARWFREGPLNSIWEGSGNVIALDVLRALSRAPGETREALAAELAPARGVHASFDRALDAALAWLAGPQADEAGARRRTEQLALLLQAGLLIRHAPAPVADAFVAARLDAPWRGSFGTLPEGVDTAAILARALP